jgi:hypothetical protein
MLIYASLDKVGLGLLVLNTVFKTFSKKKQFSKFLPSFLGYVNVRLAWVQDQKVTTHTRSKSYKFLYFN